MGILSLLNSAPMYAICGGIIAFVAAVCIAVSYTHLRTIDDAKQRGRKGLVLTCKERLIPVSYTHLIARLRYCSQAKHAPHCLTVMKDTLATQTTIAKMRCV